MIPENVDRHERLEPDVIERVRSGDRDAFGTVFRAYYSGLCAYAERYVGSADDAEEVVGDVFFRIWTARERWRVDGSLRAYLYRAVRNESLKWLEHRRVVDRVDREARAEGRSPGMGQRAPEPDVDLARSELSAAVRCAIESLPNRCRETLVLHRHHGMSYAEVAEVMGVTAKTVENQLARALRLLRERLAAWSP